MYHEYDPPEWTGETGFYQADYRAPPAANESKTWAPLCVWAEPTYSGDTMQFSMQSSATYPPPTDREYLLELVQVPEGVTGAPPVGTVWTLPLNQTFTLTLPTYRTANGLEGYQFAFAIAAVPTPTESIATPSSPSGPSSRQANNGGDYSTGGSTSNLGHGVEYEFAWGDGTQSSWGPPSRSHSWSSPGTYVVKARARCATHPGVMSVWSSSLTVTVTAPERVTLTILVEPAVAAETIPPAEHPRGEVVTVAAPEPQDPCDYFIRWTGDVPVGHEYDSPLSITMDADKTLTANFYDGQWVPGFCGIGGGCQFSMGLVCLAGLVFMKSVPLKLKPVTHRRRTKS